MTNGIINIDNDNTILKLHNIKTFDKPFYDNVIDLSKIKELFISGSIIDNFAFLDGMNGLNKLVFLACKSGVWNELHGKETVKILRLHNIKEGKNYIKNIDFISEFKNLEYIYLNMLGIELFPDVSKLNKLHTVCCSNRKLYDYTSLEYANALKTFIGWCETDNHRTTADAFIPILKNKNLKEFQYTQVFNVENKKLDSYVKQYCSNIIYPIDTISGFIVNNEKTMEIINKFF